MPQPRLHPLITVLIAVVLSGAAPLSAQAPTLEQKAVSWMTLLMEDEFEDAAAELSPDSPIPADQLKAFWPQIETRYGTLRRVDPINRITVEGFQTVQLLGYFDREDQTSNHTIRVSFDDQGRPVAFFILDDG